MPDRARRSPNTRRAERPTVKKTIRKTSQKRSPKRGEVCSFKPRDAKMCLATVHGGSGLDKTRFAMEWLTKWLRFQSDPRVRESPAHKYAVVFDIDDTLVDDAQNKIEPVVEVYRLARFLGFRCAIVTARPEIDDNRAVTEAMLHRRGIRDWDSLHMMPARLNKDISTISLYKSSARDHVTRRCTILANVGDMWHDHVHFPLTSKTGIIRTLSPNACAVMFVDGVASVKLVSRA